MPAPETSIPSIALPPDGNERLALANQLYREFYLRCFWHSPPDLVITDDLIPFVMKGLRTYGGHRGFILAGKLRPEKTPFPIPERELPECR